MATATRCCVTLRGTMESSNPLVTHVMDDAVWAHRDLSASYEWLVTSTHEGRPRIRRCDDFVKRHANAVRQVLTAPAVLERVVANGVEALFSCLGVFVIPEGHRCNSAKSSLTRASDSSAPTSRTLPFSTSSSRRPTVSCHAAPNSSCGVPSSSRLTSALSIATARARRECHQRSSDLCKLCCLASCVRLAPVSQAAIHSDSSVQPGVKECRAQHDASRDPGPLAAPRKRACLMRWATNTLARCTALRMWSGISRSMYRDTR